MLGSDGQTGHVQTPKKAPNRYNLFVKEHFHTMKQSQPHLSTPQLMKHLSEKYRKTNEHPRDPIELPDLDRLKI